MASLTQAQRELLRGNPKLSRQGSRDYAVVTPLCSQREGVDSPRSSHSAERDGGFFGDLLDCESPGKSPSREEVGGFVRDLFGCQDILCGNKFLSLLLINIPLGFAAHVLGWDAQWRFTLNFLGIIPLAWLIGKATEDLAVVTNETVGGLINATFGNVVEMLLCIAGIRQNQIIITQCTLIGSILSNLLLVMGTAFLVGGLLHKTQHFSQKAAQLQCALLALSVLSMGLPTVYVNILHADSEWKHMVNVSRWSSCLLLIIYFAYLFFQLHTHKHLFEGEGEGGEEDAQPDLGPWAAALLLSVATIATKFSTYFLIAAIEGTVESLELSKEFIGIILLPIIGNAADHYTAITVAARNKMDLSLGVAAGSACQMALLVTPFTVLVGWCVGREMTLDFHLFQFAVMLMSVVVVTSVIGGGHSNWLVGLMLIAAYLIIALMYYVEGTGKRSSLATLA